MSQYQEIIYVPEGRISNLSSFSGISHFFGQALARQCQLSGIHFNVAEFPYCLEMEELLILAFSENPTILRNRIANEKSWAYNVSVADQLIGANQLIEDIILIIEKYWEVVETQFSQEWLDGISEETAIIRLSPFVPRIAITPNTYFYLDCSNSKFFLSSSTGTLRKLNIPNKLVEFVHKAEGTSLKNSKKVFSFSEKAKSEIKHLHAIEHIEVVGAGPNLAKPIVPLVNSTKTTNLNITFIGRDFKRKGGPSVLKMAKILPAHNFVIVTDTNFSTKDQTNIKLIRDASVDQVSDILATTDIFFFPTCNEPFGLVILEAMAHQLPVISSSIGAIPEMISSQWLCSPNDISGFSKMIDKLAKEPNLRARVGLENATKVRNWGWDISATRIVEQIYGT